MALYERYAVLPLSDITSEVRKASSSQQQQQKLRPEVAHVDTRTATTAPIAPPAVQPYTSDAATFLAAAQLLQRSGESQRAHAVLAGLPSEVARLQPCNTLAEHTSTATASAQPVSSLSSSSPPLTSSQADASHDLRSTSEEADNTSDASLTWLQTSELVQRAFSLRGVHSADTNRHTSEAAALFRELLRRHAWLAAAQCMMNWHRRGLLVLPSTSLTTTRDTVTTPQTTEEMHTTVQTHSSDAAHEAADLFDAVGAFRSYLFADLTTNDAHDASTREKDEHDGQDDAVWQVLLEHDAPLFAACVLHSDTAEVLRPLLQKSQASCDGAAVLRQMTHRLLIAVCTCARAYTLSLSPYTNALPDIPARPLLHGMSRGNEGDEVEEDDDEDTHALFDAVLHTSATSPSLPSLPSSSSSLPIEVLQVQGTHNEGEAMHTVGLLWSAMAAVTACAEAALRAGNKAEKQGMLYHLVQAMQATHTLFMSQMPHSYTARTAPPPLLLPHEVMCCAAVRTTVDTLCRAVLGHEAQVRFIGLAAFADVSLAYTALLSLSHKGMHCDAEGVNTSHKADAARTTALPEALLACLFLCMGGPTYRNTDKNDNDALVQYLRAAPLERWQYALQLLTQHAMSGVMKTTGASSMQLRCVLSGLQSISFRRTWHQALRCTELCMHTLHVTPDDATMVKLLHNLRQISWQRAFDVLRFYEQRRTSPAAAVLRDLQLIACKYDPQWRTTVTLMQRLVDEHGERAAGRLCCLYSLHAAASAGVEQLPLCYSLFLGLKAQPTRTASSSSSALQHPHTDNDADTPYTAACVAVPLVAMLDNGHAAAAATFAAWLREPSTRHALRPCALTEAARRVAAAGELLGLLFSDQHDALTALLLREDTRTESTSRNGSEGDTTSTSGAAPLSTLTDSPLAHVLHKAVELYWLLDMRELHAPVRLVYDVLEPGRYVRLDAVGNFETHASAGRLPATLYVPPRLRRRQNVRLAVALGRYVKAHSADAAETPSGRGSGVVPLPSSIACTIAACMTSCQVGPEYLRAAIL